MTFGQKIKKLRVDAGLTQKDLADKMNVSFQTVSKWESDLNEPDISSIKALSKIFNCSFEYLLGDDAELATNVAPKIITNDKEIKIGHCRDCNKDLYDSDLIHNIERKYASGVKEMVTICDDCFQKHEREIDKKVEEINKSIKPSNSIDSKNNSTYKGTHKDNTKILIWSIVVGAIGFITTLVLCIVFNKYVPIGLIISLPIIVGYAFLAGIYCLFSVSWINDLFLDVASWSIKMPGVIFSFDSDGIKFLITMKIFLWLLGIALALGAIVFAFLISAVCSIFTFPFLIFNKK